MNDATAIRGATRLAGLVMLLLLLWILGNAAGIASDLSSPRTSALKRIVYTTGAPVPADWQAYPTPGGWTP